MALTNAEAVALRVIELIAILLPVIAILMQITVRYYLSESFDLSNASKILVFVAGVIAIGLFAAGAGGSGWYLMNQNYGDLVDFSIRAILGGIALVALMGIVLLSSFLWGTRDANKPEEESQTEESESATEVKDG